MAQNWMNKHFQIMAKVYAFTFTLSLSNFHFQTFTFKLSLSISNFHFHTFTFTLSLSHFHCHTFRGCCCRVWQRFMWRGGRHSAQHTGSTQKLSQMRKIGRWVKALNYIVWSWNIEEKAQHTGSTQKRENRKVRYMEPCRGPHPT